MRKDEINSHIHDTVIPSAEQILERIDRIAAKRNIKHSDHQAIRASIQDLFDKHTTANDTIGR